MDILSKIFAKAVDITAHEAGESFLKVKDTGEVVKATSLLISHVDFLQGVLDGKEPIFTKNSAFNKNFGTETGTVAQGNDIRINRGNTAYNWGDFRDYGLGNLTLPNGSWDFANNVGTSFHAGINHGIQGLNNNTSVYGITSIRSEGYGYNLALQNDNMYFQTHVDGVVHPWRKIWHNGNYDDFKDYGLGITGTTGVPLPGNTLDNTTLASGLYAANSDTIDSPVSENSGTVIVERAGAVGYVTQKIQHINANDTVNMLIRHYRPNSAAWSSWARLWHDKDFSQGSVNNWNSAHSWGNHASIGYLTSLPAHDHDDSYAKHSLVVSGSLNDIIGTYGTGFYLSDQNPVGSPSSYTGRWNMVQYNMGNYGFQIAYTAGIGYDQLYFRNGNTSTSVGTWRKIWHDWNLADPATQTWVNAQGYKNHLYSSLGIPESTSKWYRISILTSSNHNYTGTFTVFINSGAGSTAQTVQFIISNGQNIDPVLTLLSSSGHNTYGITDIRFSHSDASWDLDPDFVDIKVVTQSTATGTIGVLLENQIGYIGLEEVIQEATEIPATGYIQKNIQLNQANFQSTGSGIFYKNLTAAAFVKSGGTSSQFLKADGSIDSTGYVSKSGDTMTGELSISDAFGTVRMYGAGIFLERSASYIRSDVNSGKSLYMGGAEMGFNDWLNLNFYVTGEFKVNDNNIWHAGNFDPSGYEPSFTKNTGFNKNFGTVAGTVSEGNHNHDGRYLQSFTESDPTVPSHVKNITTSDISSWNAAVGWGDHSLGGYASASHTHDYVPLSGNRGNGSDANNLLGIFGTGRMVLDSLNTPKNYLTVLNIPESVGSDFQLASYYGVTVNELWFRGNYDQGDWKPWVQVWHTGNLRSNTENDSRYFSNNASSVGGVVNYATIDAGNLTKAGVVGGWVDTTGAPKSDSEYLFINPYNAADRSPQIAIAVGGGSNFGNEIFYRARQSYSWNEIFHSGNHRSNSDNDIRYAYNSHNHSASNITSGTLNLARIPTGTSGSTVALGDHNHSSYALASRVITAESHLSGGGNLTADINIGLALSVNNYINDNQGNPRLYFGTSSSGSNGTIFRNSHPGHPFQFRDSSNSIVFQVLYDGRVSVNSQFIGVGSHLSFNRNSHNYITASDATGSLAFVTGGRTPSTANSSLILNSGGTSLFNSDLEVRGTGVFTGDVIAFSTSDKRLKDNVQTIERPLERLNKLGGYSFDWNSKQKFYSGKDYGVIAQEVEEIFPEMVTTRLNGYKAVKYEKLVPVLIEAVKELSKELENLKSRT